jgi:hypothetical protein
LRRRRLLPFATAVIAVLAVALFAYAFVESRRGPDGPLTIVIPAQAGERQRAGEVLDFLPAIIELEVGEALDIRNEDDEPHVIGPFFLEPGKTTTYRFSQPELITGVCSLHKSGNITIRVDPVD